MDVDIGRLVAGKYELVRLLGRGSMGEVWVAHHRTLGERVALKLLTPSPSAGMETEDPATAAARFLFEAQVAARLSRKTRHIVSVTDHGEEEGLVYLVMELLDGETLEEVLVREGRMPAAAAVEVVTQVARALSVAHADGVLHRDLKPANVFLSRDEDGRLLVKLLDFGIARAIHAHKAPGAVSTARGFVFGTPGYMSPEQTRASAKLDHRCDLWALATIAYELLSGRLPVEGEDSDELVKNIAAGRIVPIEQRMPEIGKPLAAFFRRAFADAIGIRFASATDLARAFEHAASPGARQAGEGSEFGAVEPPSVEPLATVVEAGSSRPLRSRRGIVVALALLVSLVAMGAAWRGLAGSPPAPSPVTATPAPSASAALPVVPSPPIASEVLADPAVPVSALPRMARPPGAPPTLRGPGPTAREPSAPTAITAAPGVGAGAPPPVSVPPPAPPSAAPAPSPAPTKVDKSEVL